MPDLVIIALYSTVYKTFHTFKQKVGNTLVERTKISVNFMCFTDCLKSKMLNKTFCWPCCYKVFSVGDLQRLARTEHESTPDQNLRRKHHQANLIIKRSFLMFLFNLKDCMFISYSPNSIYVLFHVCAYQYKSIRLGNYIQKSSVKLI